MINTKEIFKLLQMSVEQPFKITRPSFEGIYRLTKDLYIQKQIKEHEWESSHFQLCDLFNGALEIQVLES